MNSSPTYPPIGKASTEHLKSEGGPGRKESRSGNGAFNLNTKYLIKTYITFFDSITDFVTTVKIPIQYALGSLYILWIGMGLTACQKQFSTYFFNCPDWKYLLVSLSRIRTLSSEGIDLQTYLQINQTFFFFYFIIIYYSANKHGVYLEHALRR